MRRRMTIEKLEKLNNSDSQELVSTTTSFTSPTPEMARRPSPRLPSPRSPIVQIHTEGKYSTPTQEMVPKVKIQHRQLLNSLCVSVEQTFEASSYAASWRQARGSHSSRPAAQAYTEAPHP